MYVRDWGWPDSEGYSPEACFVNIGGDQCLSIARFKTNLTVNPCGRHKQVT